jgi:hypothetical protein
MAYFGYGGLYNGYGGGYGYGGLGYGYGGPGFGVGSVDGLANIATTERVGIGLGNEIAQFGFTNRDAIERNGDKSVFSTQNFGLANLLATERNGTTNLIATERNLGLLGSSINQNTGLIISTVQNAISNQNTIAAQYDAANAIRAKDIQLQLSNSTGLLSTQISDSKNQIQKDISESKSALALLSTQQTNAIQLQAAQNSATTDSKIDKCCCETNMNITATGNKTDNLITTLDNARVKDALLLANTANLLLRAGFTAGNLI